TNGTQFLGWGYHGSQGRAFRVDRGPDIASTKITDLGMTPDLDPATTANISIAADMSQSGEIVGGVYDHWPFWPSKAFIWVEGAGMVDLNDFVDHDRWQLQVAYAINDNHKVVGLGVHNGKRRAFMMTVPDVRPCTAPDDDHLTGERIFATGDCTIVP